MISEKSRKEFYKKLEFEPGFTVVFNGYIMPFAIFIRVGMDEGSEEPKISNVFLGGQAGTSMQDLLSKKYQKTVIYARGKMPEPISNGFESWISSKIVSLLNSLIDN